jgi:D-lactate dehydrogenase (cytochrome)
MDSITIDYYEYLKDESRKEGKADSISFPCSEKEIIDIILFLNKDKTKVTIQGARTGITAGAVPEEGHILNLKKMNRITGLRYEKGHFFLSVQPGVLLTDVRKAIAKKDFDTSGWSQESIETLRKMKTAGDFFFPPDPTETTASIGGMVACNASGARSFYYGPTRKYVEGLSVILADGSTIRLKRNIQKSNGYSFCLKTDTGRLIQGKVPKYCMPNVKNASGYFAEGNMDLIDLFIGSEGTLGIASEIEIRLLKKPKYTWGGMFFFQQEENAVKFVRLLRENRENEYIENARLNAGFSERFIDIKPVAIEYFNSESLDLLRRQKENINAFSQIPDIKKEFNSAIYVEFDEDSEEDIIDSMIDAARRSELCGGKEENNWIASTSQLMECMKLFRHAVPEAVNLIIDQRRRKDPKITKLGTDMAVPDDKLEEVMKMYKSDLVEHGFESVMFGHIGDNHIHVNILPRTMEEYYKGKELYAKWADKVLEVGGTVSAEHGIGKLKIDFLEMMYGQQGIREMTAVRNIFDPYNMLNSGNLFRNENRR